MLAIPEPPVPVHILDLPFDRADYYTAVEAATVVGVDRSAILHLVRRGHLPAIKLEPARTAQLYIRKDDLAAYLAEQSGSARRGPKRKEHAP